MIIRFLVGLILMLLSIISGLIAGGAQLGIYADLAGIAILTFGSFAAVLMFHSPKEIKTAFVHAFAKDVDDAANYEPDIIFFATLHKILGTIGITGFLTGSIAMLNNRMDLQATVRGFAIALLIILYALILQVLLTIPCKAMLKKKQCMQQ